MRNSKLHIAVIQQTPDLGGAETYMALLMDHFIQSENKVTLVTNQDKFIKYVKDLKIKSYKIPYILDVIGNYRGLIKSILLLPWALYYYTRLLITLKRKKVDVIVMSGFSEKMIVTFLSIFFRFPVVWFEYGALTTIFKRNFGIPRLLYAILWKIPMKIIVPSKYTQKSLLKDTHIHKLKILYIPDGVVVPNEKRLKKKKDSKWNNRFVIGNVSRLTREKGQDLLIKAMPEILKEIPHALLLIVGEGLDRSYFQKIITELHLKNNVILTGFVPNLSEYYDSFDLFVFPTVWDLEGFGLVSAEAMAHSVPTIGSNFGPVPEVISHNKTGVLFKPDSSADIAQTIISVYKNSSLREEYAKRGRQKIEEEFNIEIISKKILHVLTKSVYEYHT